MSDFSLDRNMCTQIVIRIGQMNKKRGKKICRSQIVASRRGVGDETGSPKKLLLAMQPIVALSHYCVDRFPDQEREKERGEKVREEYMERRNKRRLKIISYPVSEPRNTISLK